MRRIVSEANSGLFIANYRGMDSLASLRKAVQVQSTMATTALGINVSIFAGGLKRRRQSFPVGYYWRHNCIVKSLCDIAQQSCLLHWTNRANGHTECALRSLLVSQGLMSWAVPQFSGL